MRIVDVEVVVSERPNPRVFRWRAGLPGSDPVAMDTTLSIRTMSRLQSLRAI